MDLTNLMLLLGGVVALVLGVWALIDLWRGPNAVGAKVIWTIGIVLLPILLAVLYLVTRPGSKLQEASYGVSDDRDDIIQGDRLDREL